MKLTNAMRLRLLNLCQRIALSKQPDFLIGPKEDPYLIRHYLKARAWWLSMYYHIIRRDDEDRALHDHVSLTISLILETGYFEVTDKGTFERFPGDILIRSPFTAHRLVCKRDSNGNIIPAKTIFITLVRLWKWGFYCPEGWVHYLNFVNGSSIGEVGRGCGEADLPTGFFLWLRRIRLTLSN